MRIKTATIITSLLFIAFNGNAQNSELAREYYNQAKSYKQKGNLAETIRLIEMAKKNLESTNPDILFLEATTRFESDINLNKTKLLLEEFIEKSKENDERRVVVNDILTEFRKPNFLYSNGNRTHKKLEVPETTITNGIETKIHFSFILYNEDGNIVSSAGKISYNDDSLFTMSFGNDINNPNQILKFESIENLNNGYCTGVLGGISSYYIYHPNIDMLTGKKARINQQDIKIIEYNNNSLSETLKRFLKENLNIDIDKIGIATKFKLTDVNTEYVYELDENLKDIFRINIKKEKKYKFNPKLNKWEKVKFKKN